VTARFGAAATRSLTLGALIRAPTVREGLPPTAQYHAVRDLVEAEQNLNSAIQRAPDYFEAHLKLGQLLLARGDTAGAEPHLRKAAESPDPRIRTAAQEAR